METHLTYDNKGKQLGILVKERFTTDQNLQLKVRLSPCCTKSSRVSRSCVSGAVGRTLGALAEIGKNTRSIISF